MIKKFMKQDLVTITSKVQNKLESIDNKRKILNLLVLYVKDLIPPRNNKVLDQNLVIIKSIYQKFQ